MDLSIIIVNWNSVEFLRKCLASVYTNTHSLEFEIVVVDNASFDGSEAMVRAEYPAVRFVQSGVNHGFAAANNLGVAQASGSTLMFLNPDTEVTGSAVQVLHSTVQRLPDAGVVGAKLLNTDGTIQTSCIQPFPTILNQALDAESLRKRFPRLSLWGMRPLLEKQTGPAEVDMISGACLMMSKRLFEAVGGFTTDYFMYAEDLDLCYKVRETGRRNYYVDDAEVVHHGGGSTSSAGGSHFSAIVMRDSLLKFFVLRRGRARAWGYRISVGVVAGLRCAIAGLSLAAGGRQSLAGILSRWRAVLSWSLGLNEVPHSKAGSSYEAGNR